MYSFYLNIPQFTSPGTALGQALDTKIQNFPFTCRIFKHLENKVICTVYCKEQKEIPCTDRLNLIILRQGFGEQRGKTYCIKHDQLIPSSLRWAACLLDILLEDDWKICGWISVCNRLTINLFHLQDSYESEKCAKLNVTKILARIIYDFLTL